MAETPTPVEVVPVVPVTEIRIDEIGRQCDNEMRKRASAVTALESKLSGWTGPSSDSEQEKQERTERMIREAVNASPSLSTMSRQVYTKGSYANNTNVRSDSDVDVAVECHEALYSDAAPGVERPSGSPYTGEWTPAKLRTELIAALRDKFGDAVDTSGSTAIHVVSTTARVEADVVPCFDYRYYLSPTSFREGAKVFKTNGNSIVNYSNLQLTNGRAKNNRTGQAYKKTVRILKRLENAMVEAGAHREVPSFFVECLTYNCPDSLFGRNSWTAVTKAVLAHIYEALQGDEPSDDSARWLEVNEAKYLFHSAQKWSRKDGRDFAQAGWSYLDLGNA